MFSKKMEEFSTATSKGFTKRAVMSDDGNFEFAFNSETFSDRILKIEVADEPPPKDIDSKGVQIRDLKWEKCKETANNDKELDSAAAADSSEIILRVESIQVNSAILAAKSKFFFKLFSNGMKESDQQHLTVRVCPSEETAFMELIRFMYSGKLSSISPPFLLSVLTLADKFEVPTCMNQCIQQAMALPMTTESALLYLDAPPALSMVSAFEPLVDVAKEFLGNKYKKIMDVPKEELWSLSVTAIEAIFGRDDLEIPQEDVVCDILVEWARARYPKPDERRAIFNHRLAPLVRFAHTSYGRLTQLLASIDLNGDHVSKLTADALIFKAESPLRQRELRVADGWFAERSYTNIPFKMVELESQFPHCIIYLDLKKDKLAKLFPSGMIRTQEIRLGGERFRLAGDCNLDQQQRNGAHCFGFYLYSLHDKSEKITVACEFDAWSKSLEMFELKANGVYNLKRGKAHGIGSLLGVPWTTLMAEDSPYFVDGILRMRAQLIIKTPLP